MSERLARVVPLHRQGEAEDASRAHGMHAPCPSDEVQKHAHAPGNDFDKLVEPLGLRGPNRDICRQAFEENPDGFRRCVVDATARGRDPARLLVRMARDGDHRISEPTRSLRLGPSRAGCSHPECRYQDVCLLARDAS